MGELEPDDGTGRCEKNLALVGTDQQLKLLQPGKTVRDILADGGDWVEVLGQKKHIQGYLKAFLFEPGLADARIETLSGGEQSRLLLAPEFARRSTLMVLDEPTTDLDMDTMDMLQEVLSDYDAKVLVASPDRDSMHSTITAVVGQSGS